MRVLILSSSLRGFGAYCLPRLAKVEEVDVVKVVYSEGRQQNRKRYWKRKLRKTFKIGLLGALNGIRMRRWFDVREMLDIKSLRESALEHELEFETTPTINCERTIDIFEKAQVDLGLSLGNSYISQSVFQIPKYGMINVHHEQLPEFQGAQSVLWQIYHRSTTTGYTIHQINSRIDEGKILYKEETPIQFKDSLQKTVTHNYARLYEKSVDGLIRVLRDYPAYHEAAQPQNGGNSYTTPSVWQFFRMVWNHRVLSQESKK